MKLRGYNPCFKGLKIGNLTTIDRICLSYAKGIEKLAENVDVFIKSSSHDFPYNNSLMNVPAIKIVARPKNLTFFERLSGKKTKAGYFPTGNMREMIKFDKSKSLKDTIAEVVSQVEQK